MLNFRISVWIGEDKQWYTPTVYTIDYLNNFITFERLGKTHMTTLDNIKRKPVKRKS